MLLSYDFKNPAADDHFLKRYERAGDMESVRNQILHDMMQVVDGEYRLFEKQLRADRAYKGVVVKLLSLALSGVAALNAGHTAQSLAAADMRVLAGAQIRMCDVLDEFQALALRSTASFGLIGVPISAFRMLYRLYVGGLPQGPAANACAG